MNADHSNLRVLVAEGSAILRSRLCQLVNETPGLALAGEAGLAVEAYLLHLSRQPDAVLINVRMPDASGLQLMRRIKESNPGCLVTMLCDDGNDDYRTLCQRLGADHFFHLATEFEEVFAVLARAANRTPPRAPRGGVLPDESSYETTEKNP